MRKRMGVVLLVALAVFGSASSSYAGDDDGGGRCFTDLLNCYTAAAGIADFWWRFAAALDCELDFVECVRVKIIGD